jgi:hypothetical protein
MVWPNAHRNVAVDRRNGERYGRNYELTVNKTPDTGNQQQAY